MSAVTPSALAAMDLGPMILMVLVLAGILVAAAVTVLILRRSYRDGLAPRRAPGPFTLDELRQMRQRGQIDEEEYCSLRDEVIRQSQQQ